MESIKQIGKHYKFCETIARQHSRKDLSLEYQEFAISELMLALMEDDKKSVRRLAEIVGLSPTAIQDLRSGKAKDVKFKNFLNIV